MLKSLLGEVCDPAEARPQGVGVSRSTMKTLKVSLAIGQLVSRDGFACQDEGQREKPLGSRIAKVNASPAHAFGRLQSTTQEELDALLPSISPLSVWMMRTVSKRLKRFLR